MFNARKKCKAYIDFGICSFLFASQLCFAGTTTNFSYNEL